MREQVATRSPSPSSRGIGARRFVRSATSFLACAVVLLSCLCAFRRTALADDGGFALSWSPSAESPCVAPEALEDAVAARLGRPPFVAVDRADVIVEGRELPTTTTGRQRAVVEQRDRAGHVLGSRELEAASCAELRRAAAFVIVLMIDPDALLRESPPETSTRAPQPRPQPVTARRRSERARPSARRPPPRSLVQAGAGISFASGLLPGGDGGGLLTLGVTPWSAPVRFEWRGGYRRSLAAPRGRDFSALAQEWRACLLLRPRASLGGSACAGGMWTAIYPEVEGLTDGDQAPKTDFGPVVAAGPILDLGAFTVATELSVLLPQRRYAFTYLDDMQRPRPLHEVGPAVVSATIGLVRAF